MSEPAGEALTQTVTTAEQLLERAQAAWTGDDPAVARELAGQALQHPDVQRESSLEFEARMLLGRIQRASGSLAEAAASFASAAQAARRSGDVGRELSAINLQASAVHGLGQQRRALGMLERALQTAIAAGELDRAAGINSNIGELRRAAGNYPEALEALVAAQEHYDAQETVSRASAVNLINLGNLNQDLGRPTEARRLFSQALEVGSELPDDELIAVALNNLANCDLAAGDYTVAGERFREALRLARHLSSAALEIDNLDGLGQVLWALGDHSTAAGVYAEALEVARTLDDREGQLDALVNLAEAAGRLGQHADAITSLLEALGLAEELELRSRQFEIHRMLSDEYEAAGDPWGALRHSRLFHALESAVFNEQNEERISELLVRFELDRSQHEAEKYRIRTEIMQEAIEQAEDRIRERTAELEEAHLDLVARLALATEFRDDNTGQHIHRVGRSAAVLAWLLGFSRDDSALLYFAAKLHDVGKIGIPDAVLRKQGRLTVEEQRLIHDHTVTGARLLSGGRSRLLKAAEQVCLAHHERFDGKGYPFGLAAAAIPWCARIVTVADVLDALIHERPYKEAWPLNEALAEIRSQAGRQFDPDVVEACLQAFGGPANLTPFDTLSTREELDELLEDIRPWRLNMDVERVSEW